MRTFALLFMLLFSIASYAQDWNAIAEADLLKQEKAFTALVSIYNVQKAELESTSVTDPVYDDRLKVLRETKKKLDTLFATRKESLAFYKLHITSPATEATLIKLFPEPSYIPSGSTVEAIPPKEVYIVYGDDKIVA